MNVVKKTKRISTVKEMNVGKPIKSMKSTDE